METKQKAYQDEISQLLQKINEYSEYITQQEIEKTKLVKDASPKDLESKIEKNKEEIELFQNQKEYYEEALTKLTEEKSVLIL